jgi:hypothetical protein
MKTIYHVSLGDDTVSGMFTEEGILLDFWHDNDATWRDEYFAGFMAKLGFTVGDPPKKLEKAMMKTLRETADPNGEWE